VRRKEVAPREENPRAKLLLRAFGFTHAILALLFAVAALLLLAIAVKSGWSAFSNGFGEETALALIEALGIGAVAVVSLQISQTIAEEEVIRGAHVSVSSTIVSSCPVRMTRTSRAAESMTQYSAAPAER